MSRPHYRRITRALDDCACDTGDDLVSSIRILWESFDTLVADMRNMTLDACEQIVHDIVRSASYDLVHYATGTGVSSGAWRVAISRMAQVLIKMIVKPTGPLCCRTLSIHAMTRGAGLASIFGVSLTSMLDSDVTAAKEYALLLAMYDPDPGGELTRLVRDITRVRMPRHTPPFLANLNTAVAWIPERYARLAGRRVSTSLATQVTLEQYDRVRRLTAHVTVDTRWYGRAQRDALWNYEMTEYTRCLVDRQTRFR